jgi:hypothetical protein
MQPASRRRGAASDCFFCGNKFRVDPLLSRIVLETHRTGSVILSLVAVR